MPARVELLRSALILDLPLAWLRFGPDWATSRDTVQPTSFPLRVSATLGLPD